MDVIYENLAVNILGSLFIVFGFYFLFFVLIERPERKIGFFLVRVLMPITIGFMFFGNIFHVCYIVYLDQKGEVTSISGFIDSVYVYTGRESDIDDVRNSDRVFIINGKKFTEKPVISDISSLNYLTVPCHDTFTIFYSEEYSTIIKNETVFYIISFERRKYLYIPKR